MLDRFAAFLRLELAPSPARWRATARIVIACAIATTAVMIFRIPEGFWLIITILIVSQPDAGASVIRAIERSAGTLIGGGFAIALAVFPLVWEPQGLRLGLQGSSLGLQGSSLGFQS